MLSCVIKSNYISFSQAKTKGLDTKVDIGVKYADKQERHFDDDKMKAGQCVIGLQVRHPSFNICLNDQNYGAVLHTTKVSKIIHN